MWRANGSLFRRIYVRFDYEELPSKNVLVIATGKDIDLVFIDSYSSSISQEERERPCCHKKQHCVIAWAQKLDFLHQVNLTKLKINVTNCDGFASCRRMLTPLLPARQESYGTLAEIPDQ